MDKEKSLLFLPGFATTDQVFKNLSRQLASEFKITEQLPANFIIAWSMGVFQATKLYFQNPKEVKKMIFVSGTPKFLKDDGYEAGISKALFRNLERKIQNDKQSGINFFYKLIGNGKEYAEFKSMPEFPAGQILSSLEKLKTEDVRRELPKIAVPVLLIHGADDKICLPEASGFMAELLPQSRLEIYNDAAHAPFLDQPERFVKEVSEFLKC